MWIESKRLCREGNNKTDFIKNMDIYFQNVQLVSKSCRPEFLTVKADKREVKTYFDIFFDV